MSKPLTVPIGEIMGEIFLPPVRLCDGELIPQGEKRHALSRKGVEELEGVLLEVPGATECNYPLEHLFAPGVYIRKITMPAGEFIIGAEHTEEHFNIVLSGRASVIMDEKVHEIEPGMIFVSKAGVRKVLQIHSRMEWLTVHSNPSDERDTTKLEARLCVMSATHRAFFEQLKPA